MSYPATVVNVMVASPGDVIEERNVFRDVVLEWNAANSQDRGVFLSPMAWETHSFPDWGERPQGILNTQIVDKSDVLVVIFWHRLGMSTGVEASGTVEELKRHVAGAKPTMVYFSERPVPPSEINADQYKALQEFKSYCRERALYHVFSTAHEFREKFTRHLAQVVVSRFKRPASLVQAGGSVPGDLSDEARTLLLRASRKDAGSFSMTFTMGPGIKVSAGNTDLVDTQDMEEQARWRNVVGELTRVGFAEDRTGKDELFFLTQDGWASARALEKEEMPRIIVAILRWRGGPAKVEEILTWTGMESKALERILYDLEGAGRITSQRFGDGEVRYMFANDPVALALKRGFSGGSPFGGSNF